MELRVPNDESEPTEWSVSDDESEFEGPESAARSERAEKTERVSRPRSEPTARRVP
jgi:hypothetical protein